LVGVEGEIKEIDEYITDKKILWCENP